VNKILILGGAGYVGSVVTSHFLNKGDDVTIIDNFIYENQEAIISFVGNPKFHIVKGDFSDNSILNNIIDDIDYVLILAGLVGDPITKIYPKTSKRINDVNLKKSIDYFDDKKIKKLVFISTCSNYGLIPGNELAHEEFNLNPLSLYAKSKVSCENYLLSKKGYVDYSGIVLRFATAFGLSPRMRFDLTISEFTRQLFFKKKLIVFDENTWRPYCHVRDFSRLIDIVFSAKKSIVDFEVFNSGGEQNNYTKKMIIDCISTKIDDIDVEYNQNDSDPRNYRVDFSKVNRLLGFKPKISVEQGVDELIHAFKLGLFNESILNSKKYGNYKLSYSID
tara:strand:+ start:692 stop:1693 length:1002 start_codon:yes stop_codon:yes gene_type:complete